MAYHTSIFLPVYRKGEEGDERIPTRYPLARDRRRSIIRRLLEAFVRWSLRPLRR